MTPNQVSWCFLTTAITTATKNPSQNQNQNQKNTPPKKQKRNGEIKSLEENSFIASGHIAVGKIQFTLSLQK